MRVRTQATETIVSLIAKPGDSSTGVGRYVQALEDQLDAREMVIKRYAPRIPPLGKPSYAVARKIGLDAQAFLTNYPLWPAYPAADVYHFTSQNLASMLRLRRPRGRVVVTVHDIIPYMLRTDRILCPYRTVADRVVDYLAMMGLRKADHLIAVSHYTKQCLVDELNIPASRIDVAYNGVDHRRFYPTSVSDAIRAQYGLPSNRRYLIVVGSEDPRKNLRTLVQALAQIRRVVPDVELVKVGRARFEDERRRIVELAQQLGVRNAIHFLGDVAENALPQLYNLADVCVMPSLYEGFGFPVLEAMACGTPVVCAQASSLPELVGSAALMFRPGKGDSADLANAILHVLTNPVESDRLRARGLERAAMFTWSRCATQVHHIYSRDQAAVQAAT